MKVYAKITGIQREAGSSVEKFEVSFSLLYGATRTDTVALSGGTYTNETSLIYNLKQQLKAHLNTVYAPEGFFSSDIVLFG